jgi:hydrogenase expression/formation protein HypE
MSSAKILLGHGSGGTLSHHLIKDIFFPFFKNEILEQLDDAALIMPDKNKLAFSTDSYVVDPIFFPGGDIGKIAVCGTVNDLAMMGAKPLYLSTGFIIEEGFLVDDLKRILKSMQQSAGQANVKIVTGDIKVVHHRAVDKIFINTSGIGEIIGKGKISGRNARAGDVIIINGSIGEHSIAVMAQREGLELDVDLKTDAAPLNQLVAKMLQAVPDIHALRDPTRGGVATTLNEIALASQVAIKIREDQIPVSSKVRAVCEILGFDPLYLANEGKLVVFCPEKKTADLLKVMKTDKYGRRSCVIGEVIEKPAGKVFMETRMGGQRIIDMLAGEQLPRIC